MKTANAEHDDPAARHTRLVVRVLQGLVAATVFESYGDLAEALKRRLATLRIPYDSTTVSAAIDRLELGGRRRIVPMPIRPRRHLVEKPIDPDPIDKAAASTILETLEARLRR